MVRISSVASSVIAAFALAGCASQAARPVAAPAGSIRDEGGPEAPRTEAPRGRLAGTRIIQIGAQRTLWDLHCPTDSPSPLREPCSLTRSDLGPR
jgi:hypothetical protein